MNPLDIISPYKWLLYGALALSVVVGVPLIVHRYNDGLREEGRAEVRAADKAAAGKQTTDNRDRGRAVEVRYVTKAERQDRFFVTTVKEIHESAAPLAACPLPEPVRVRLNAAGQCAFGDSPTACDGDNQVPSTR